ncbi:MAG: AEC family transporter [Ectothiorhodospiraceae bacterium]|nr:AEC family transporter [Ectothiorhodospiraceae bacterium]
MDSRFRRHVLIVILDILAPIFLVIALGWLLTRSGFLSGQALLQVNRLAYWVALPALLVHRIAQASPDVDAVAGLLVVGGGATVLAIVAALVVAALLGLPPQSRGTFAQGVYRGNLTFIGLPIILYAFSGPDMSSASAEASALLAFGPMVVIYNVLAVLVLLLPGATGHGNAVRDAVKGLLTNPILIACLIGLMMSLSGFSFPTLMDRSLDVVGQMALPLALLCIGGTLHTSRIRGRLTWVIAGAAMKVAMVPAIGFGLALWLGLSAEHMRIALILLACPTATASYILVKQLQGDEALASGIVVVSNLLAVPAMVVVLAVTA